MKSYQGFPKAATIDLGPEAEGFVLICLWANTWCLYIQATAFQKVSAGKQGSAQEEILHQLGSTLLSYCLCPFNSFFKAAPCFVPAAACPCLTRERITHGGPQTFISFGVNFASVVPKLMFCAPWIKAREHHLHTVGEEAADWRPSLISERMIIVCLAHSRIMALLGTPTQYASYLL